MSYNVPAVYDGFGFAIRGKRSFPRKPKTVAEKNTTKALAPTGVFVARAASSGDA
jgi:hypothetical protein